MVSAFQTIIVNGQARPYREQTLSELLAANSLDPPQPGLAVAVNATVIQQAEWEALKLQPDDRVEIIQAAAGG